MKIRPILLCSLVVLLLISGVASAQQGGRGGRRGNNGGGQGGQQQPPPPNGNGGQGQQPPPPPPGGGNGGQGGNGGGNGGGTPLSFPSSYASSFALYAVVDRPDNVSRLLYINPEALAAMQSGQPLPEGTTLVIEGYNSTVGADGKLVRGDLIPFIHVSEKINGRWRFASFSPAGTPSDPSLPDERPRTCAGCHNDVRDFVFSRVQLDGFAATQTVQYFFCGKTGRQPCN